MGMIFVPSHGGRSHCPEELTLPEDILNGIAVLEETTRVADRQTLATN
jgi:N-carbamoyl-L-amino-acid hydrolase